MTYRNHPTVWSRAIRLLSLMFHKNLATLRQRHRQLRPLSSVPVSASRAAEASRRLPALVGHLSPYVNAYMQETIPSPPQSRGADDNRLMDEALKQATGHVDSSEAAAPMHGREVHERARADGR